MDHDLMRGMFWGGVLLSTIPVLIFIGFGLMIYRQSVDRTGRRDPPTGDKEEVLS